MTDDDIIDLAQQVTRRIVGASLYAAKRYGQKPRNVFGMLGDYFRDASVLILIFVPIEVVIPEYVQKQPLNMGVVKWTIGISFVTLVMGVALEYLGDAYADWSD